MRVQLPQTRRPLNTAHPAAQIGSMRGLLVRFIRPSDARRTMAATGSVRRPLLAAAGKPSAALCVRKACPGAVASSPVGLFLPGHQGPRAVPLRASCAGSSSPGQQAFRRTVAAAAAAESSNGGDSVDHVVRHGRFPARALPPSALMALRMHRHHLPTASWFPSARAAWPWPHSARLRPHVVLQLLLQARKDRPPRHG